MKKKPDSNNAPIRPYIRQLYRGSGGLLALAASATVLNAATSLSCAWLLLQVVDLISGVNDKYTLPQLLLAAILMAGLQVAAYGCEYFSKPRLYAKAIAQYQNYVFRQISRKGVAAFSRENTGGYISALSNDAAVIAANYLPNILRMAEQSLIFVVTLVMMLYYSPILTFSSIGLSLLPIGVSLVMGNRAAKAEETVSARNEAYVSSLRDALTGFSVVKAFQAEKRVGAIVAECVERVAQAKEKRDKIKEIISALSGMAGFTVQFGVFFIGAALSLSGADITGGTVMMFVQLINYILSPIGTIPTCLAERKAALALVQKIANALAENMSQEGGAEKTALEQGIRVENLTFAYENGKNVLENISCTFEAGKSYAVVGASGSGKSTLLNLLIGFSRDYGGQIRFDDTELRELSPESLFGLASVAEQKVFIFNATIRDNITMFADFPAEDVRRAIDRAGLSALIAQRGEDYLCGENGAGLSGGEKQRLSIARSLLKNAQVLLADEATSSLDKQTACQVADAILSLEGMTRIVVTHGLEKSLLERYDGILAMKNGQIVESGSFRELMEKKGYFYSLYTVSQ